MFVCVCDTKHEMEKCPVTYNLMVSFWEEEKKSLRINNKSRLLIGSLYIYIYYYIPNAAWLNPSWTVQCVCENYYGAIKCLLYFIRDEYNII